MADKNFGVRQIDLVGTSGATNIESPNTINLKSSQVAISTDLSIGGNVVSNIRVGSGFSVGIGTTLPKSAFEVSGTARATYFVGDGSGLTGVSGTGSGIGISYANVVVGTATTINFIGSGITFSEVRSGIVTATVQTTGGTLSSNLNLGSFILSGSGATVSSGGVVAGVSSVNNFNVTHLNATGVCTVTTSSMTNASATRLNVTGVSTFVGLTTFGASLNVGVDTSVGIIMTAANGTRYRLIVENNGSLSTIALS